MWNNWHYIPGFDNYEFNWHTNEVRNIKTMRKLKVWESRWKTSVVLSHKGILHTISLWRITLLITKWPKPEWLVCCHNDGNYWNNFPENVRYDTQKANVLDTMKHRKIKFHDVSKPIRRSDWKTYRSASDAEKEMQKSHGNICQCCRWKRKTAYGYRWEYIS